MFIIGTQHQCNGIETELVANMYPADCPWCGISNADPVIISRAKGMLIMGTYQRLDCNCGWKCDKPKLADIRVDHFDEITDTLEEREFEGEAVT